MELLQGSECHPLPISHQSIHFLREGGESMSSCLVHIGRLMVLLLLLKTSSGKLAFTGNQKSKRSKDSWFSGKSKPSADFKVYLRVDSKWNDVSTVCTSDGGRKWQQELVHKGMQQGWTLPETKKLECDLCWLNKRKDAFTYVRFILYSANAVRSEHRTGSEGSQYCKWLVEGNRLYLKNFQRNDYEFEDGVHNFLTIPFDNLYRIYEGYYKATTACGKLKPELKKTRKNRRN